ncbi:MAG: hypothetical protein ACK4XY_05320 [Chloroherpetonaceae bacterium]
MRKLIQNVSPLPTSLSSARHLDLMIGIVVGIPINQERERLSTFLRLIYEPDLHSFLHF